MRMPGDAAAAAAVFWWCLVSAVQLCESMPDQYATMGNLLRSVIADDTNWKPVLKERIKLDDGETKGNTTVAGMLGDLGLADVQTIDALPVIRRLAKSRSTTGSELEFGVRVLGTAVSCHMSRTMLLHTFFAAAFAKRDEVDVPTVRSCVSKIQRKVAMYADKLAAFDRSVTYCRRYSDAVNALFAKHDTAVANAEELPVAVFAEALDALVDLSRQELHDHCGEADEQAIATTHQATENNDSMFQNLEHVDDHQLLTVIEDLEEYDYVDVSSGGVEFWVREFHVVDYRVRGNTSVEEEKEDADDEG